MFRNRLYYSLKPAIPWPLRVGLRRLAARHVRNKNSNTWPCLQSAARKPAGWPGWPDGKKFAFVLTHDVEASSGLEKTPALMNLERGMGFRSSFNFVPEGDYRVDGTLLSEMKADGFEYGVHDLHHDGSLYASEKNFRSQAPRIKQHLANWGARGFRAGFMFHQLDWLHAIEADYDLSTFDTDPFEPQPDAAETIFPFWVKNPHSSGKTGYVEMPYTLPQDFTLFMILQETTPRIWLEKLDWVAQNEGLALVNVHPDYLRLSEKDNPARTYDASFYQTLLDHVKRHYADTAWFALPSQVADHIKAVTCKI